MFQISKSLFEFAKLRAFRTFVPYVPSCLPALRAFVPSRLVCLRAFASLGLMSSRLTCLDLYAP